MSRANTEMCIGRLLPLCRNLKLLELISLERWRRPLPKEKKVSRPKLMLCALKYTVCILCPVVAVILKVVLKSLEASEVRLGMFDRHRKT